MLCLSFVYLTFMSPLFGLQPLKHKKDLMIEFVSKSQHLRSNLLDCLRGLPPRLWPSSLLPRALPWTMGWQRSPQAVRKVRITNNMRLNGDLVTFEDMMLIS